MGDITESFPECSCLRGVSCLGNFLAWNLSAATGRQGWVLPGISCRQFTRFKCQLQSGKNFLALNLLVCICVLADNVVFSNLVYWEISLVPEGVRNWGWEQPGGDIKA